MDLRKLRYFVAIADAGGFLRASKMHSISQPALSRQIAELEIEIGAQLFERGPLGVTLTPAGQRLLVESRALLQRFDGLASYVAGSQAIVRGSVKLGAPVAIAAQLFGTLARRLYDTHPEITLKCISGMTRLLDMLAANELDLGLITLADTDEIGSAWHVDKLVHEQSYLVGPIGSIDATRSLKFHELLDLPLVLSPMPHFRRGHMERLAAAAGKPLNVAAEASTVGAQASFVSQGLGYTVVPFSAALLLKVADPLEIAPIEDLRSWRVLVRRSDFAVSQASAIVSELIIQLFKDDLLQEHAETVSPDFEGVKH